MYSVWSAPYSVVVLHLITTCEDLMRDHVVLYVLGDATRRVDLKPRMILCYGPRIEVWPQLLLSPRRNWNHGLHSASDC
jgi:hypothetical protein